MKNKTILIGLAAVFIGCGDMKKTEAPKLSIFQNQQLQAKGLMAAALVDDSYTSGSMALAPLAQVESIVQEINPTNQTDYYLRCNSDTIFRIESFNLDRVSLLDRYNPSSILAQFRTKPSREVTSSVPVDLVFGPDNIALLLRYARNEAYVFKVTRDVFAHVSSLDLKDAADNDGLSEMKSGLYWDNDWYITHQRLNRNSPGSWGVVNGSQLQVFRHQPLGADPLLVDLRVRNPLGDLTRHGRTLFIAGAGDLIKMDARFGGIEVLQKDPIQRKFTSLAVWLPGKHILDVAMLNDDVLLALEYLGPSKTLLHGLSVHSGNTVELPNELQNHASPASGHHSLLKRDPDGQLWLGYFGGTNRGLWRFDEAGRVKAFLKTRLNPVNLTFCR